MASLLLRASMVLVLVASYSSARPKNDTANDLFGDVCSEALDPDYCFQVIQSIPDAKTAPDLQSLAQITITFAQSNGDETRNYLQSLIESTTNPRLKMDYSSCFDNYDEAIGSLEDAQGDLGKGDYTSVATKATAGMSEMDACEENFKTPPMTDPSQLPEKNKFFNMLCLIILRIANKLRPAAI